MGAAVGLIHFWSRVVSVLLLALTAFLTKSAYFKNATTDSGFATYKDGRCGNQLLYPSYHPNQMADFNYEGYESSEYVPYEYIANNASASPYEIRWPTYDLPSFAKKIESDFWREVPKGKHVCFVSVGKAAGSSVSGLLGFQLHGPNVYFIPSGLLPHYTTHMFHGDVNNCADDSPYYLFTLRHPLQRAQSAFLYDRDKYITSGRPGKPELLYGVCAFNTLNQLAEEGLAADGNATEVCKRLAYEVIRGFGDMYSYHLFCNYNYYVSITFSHALDQKDSKLLVIRSEHMEEDWNTAERAVGGANHVDVNMPHLNIHTKTSEDTYLSEKSQVLLCEALCNEIQFYKYLLREAVNLNEHDYAQSMAELEVSCPLQVRFDACS